MESLFTGSRVTSISSPAMYWTIQYEYQRSGVNMQYRFYWNVYLSSSSGWYNDAMQLQLFLNGSQNNISVKPFKADNKGWNYSGTTGWYTVSNKTSGTTPFYAVLKDTSANDVKATSSTYQLKIVPAASVLGTIQNFDIDSGVTIPITKYNSAYTDTLTIKVFEKTVKTVSGITNGAKVEFTEAEKKNIYDLMYEWNTATFGFVLTTTYGGTTLGTSSKYPDGTISNAKPTFTASQVSFNDSNTTITAITGSTTSNPIIVRNKSTLAITYTAATGNKGATISKYEFTLNGVTKTSTTAGGTVSFGTIDAEKDLTLTVKVTDSRKNSTTAEKTIPFVQYVKPTVAPHSAYTNIVCARCDSAGTLSASGTNLKLTIQGKWFPLTNNKNTATLTLTYVTGTTTKTVTLSATAQSSGSGNTLRSWYDYNAVVPNVTLALDAAYMVTVKCTDKFGEYGSFEKKVPSEDVNFHQREGGFGAAFGEYSTESKVLAVADDWTFKAKGGMSVGGKKITNVATPSATTDAANKSYVDALISKIYPVGAIYMSVNSTSPATLFGGTWVQIKDTFLLAAGTTYSAGATGGSATNTHHHYSSVGFDGSNAYFTQAADSNNVGSRVVTTYGTHISASANYSTSKTLRENTTYVETINIMPPYLAVYVWKRTA